MFAVSYITISAFINDIWSRAVHGKFSGGFGSELCWKMGVASRFLLLHSTQIFLEKCYKEQK